ncbi:MAG: primosomal protein N' (replication factor Y) [Parasphingorhabdus sp.]
MSDFQDCVVEVAVPVPLRKTFEYLTPSDTPLPAPGCRVLVPFGSRQMVGIVVAVHQKASYNPDKIRPLDQLLDETPLLGSGELKLLEWAANYYHHPVGEVFQAALPAQLRKIKTTTIKPRQYYRLKTSIDDIRERVSVNASKQRLVLETLRNHSQIDSKEFSKLLPGCLPALRKLIQLNLVSSESLPGPIIPQPGPTLNDDQKIAIESLLQAEHSFNCVLLKGVTGSGKTEVYLNSARRVLDSGKQVLVLVPEIALTPQLVERFRARIPQFLVALHSGLGSSERVQGWQLAQQSLARVVLGTRSAVFTPMPELGLIVVDEEHDQSFKQQDGFRYNARDVAIKRASQLDIPVMLGSATPSLETFQNSQQGRYRLAELPNRAGGATLPTINTIFSDRWPIEDGLSRPLIDAIRSRLELGEQSLVFINRRGFAPVVICNDCGWRARCTRCDSYLTLHTNGASLRCHHCGKQSSELNNCPDCKSEKFYLGGEGTQRVEARLRQIFQQARIIRIDRDNTTGQGVLEEKLNLIRNHEVDIVVGTQLLSKGHDFAGITLVGVLNSDQAMFSVDFRATERLFQAVTQVSGRAGRGDRPGQVLIQTRFPEHPCLKAIRNHDYDTFAHTELATRLSSEFPPFSHLCLIRAESVEQHMALRFLGSLALVAASLRKQFNSVDVMDPVTAPMERKAGRFRAQLLIQSPKRGVLSHFLKLLVDKLEKMPEARKVRWSIDIDPVDIT